MNVASVRLVQGLAVTGLLLVLPLFAHAQGADLNSTIRAALYSDPRTAAMSQAQVDAMVAALSHRAQQQGLTPGDITWRPIPPSGFAAVQTCSGFPTYFCTMSDAFGFEGPDYFIPIWLAAAALLFLLINALLNHHKRLPPVAAPPAPGYLQS